MIHWWLGMAKLGFWDKKNWSTSHCCTAEFARCNQVKLAWWSKLPLCTLLPIKDPRPFTVGGLAENGSNYGPKSRVNVSKEHWIVPISNSQQSWCHILFSAWEIQHMLVSQEFWWQSSHLVPVYNLQVARSFQSCWWSPSTSNALRVLKNVITILGVTWETAAAQNSIVIASAWWINHTAPTPRSTNVRDTARSFPQGGRK